MPLYDRSFHSMSVDNIAYVVSLDIERRASYEMRVCDRVGRRLYVYTRSLDRVQVSYIVATRLEVEYRWVNGMEMCCVVSY
jgi:hypothetical protein